MAELHQRSEVLMIEYNEQLALYKQVNLLKSSDECFKVALTYQQAFLKLLLNYKKNCATMKDWCLQYHDINTEISLIHQQKIDIYEKLTPLLMEQKDIESYLEIAKSEIFKDFSNDTYKDLASKKAKITSLKNALNDLKEKESDLVYKKIALQFKEKMDTLIMESDKELTTLSESLKDLTQILSKFQQNNTSYNKPSTISDQANNAKLDAFAIQASRNLNEACVQNMQKMAASAHINEMRRLSTAPKFMISPRFGLVNGLRYANPGHPSGPSSSNSTIHDVT